MYKLIILVVISLNFVHSEYKDYSNYQQFHVYHKNDTIYQHMIELNDLEDVLDFWLLSRDESIVLVPPETTPTFQNVMNSLGAVYSMDYPFLDNDQKCFSNCSHVRKKRQTGFFGGFQRYNTIVNYLKNLAATYSQHARFDYVAYTPEGRQIAILRIAPYRATGRKLIYIQGGSHAREWISVSTVLYFVTELLRNFNYYKSLLYDIEIGVVPVLNPDGYERTHTRDRLWRKNVKVSPYGSCRGVDLNRNFGHKWGLVGASKNPCSEVYAGRLPFSEKETDWVQRYLRANQYRTKLVVDVHSFGKYLLYPWGYKLASAPSKARLHQVGRQVANAIYKHRGTKYSVGTSAQLLYTSSGSLDDYAYGSLGIPLAYTIELPGRDFRISPREIIPIGKETFAGFLEFIKAVKAM